MCPSSRRAKKGNAPPVGRPARGTVGFRGLRDFDERSSGRIDDPNVLVAAFVDFLSGAIGHKSYLLAIRRPLRIAIIPIVARSDLLRRARYNVDDPNVRPPIVEPPCVIEFVISMFVMPHVAWGLPLIARSGRADKDKSRAIR